MRLFLHNIPVLVWALAVLLLTGACASSPPANAPPRAGEVDPWNGGGTSSHPKRPAVVRYADFLFPSTMAGFRRGKATEYRDKRLGFSVPYYAGNPPMVASIYVYNRGLTSIADGHASTIVRASFLSSQKAIQTAVERGTYSVARRIHQDIVRLPGDTERKFLRAVYLIRYGGRSGVRESHLMVTASRNYLWKVRCTFSANPKTRKAARAAVLRLLGELMEYQERI